MGACSVVTVKLSTPLLIPTAPGRERKSYTCCFLNCCINAYSHVTSVCFSKWIRGYVFIDMS
jgi:hypothetical protein